MADVMDLVWSDIQQQIKTLLSPRGSQSETIGIQTFEDAISAFLALRTTVRQLALTPPNGLGVDVVARNILENLTDALDSIQESSDSAKTSFSSIDVSTGLQRLCADMQAVKESLFEKVYAGMFTEENEIESRFRTMSDGNAFFDIVQTSSQELQKFNEEFSSGALHEWDRRSVMSLVEAEAIVSQFGQPIGTVVLPLELLASALSVLSCGTVSIEDEKQEEVNQYISPALADVISEVVATALRTLRLGVSNVMFHAVSRCLTSISRFPYALANIVAALWGRAQECKRQMDQSSLAIVILSCTYICLGWDNNGRAEATAVYFSRMQDILLMVEKNPEVHAAISTALDIQIELLIPISRTQRQFDGMVQTKFKLPAPEDVEFSAELWQSLSSLCEQMLKYAKKSKFQYCLQFLVSAHSLASCLPHPTTPIRFRTAEEAIESRPSLAPTKETIANLLLTIYRSAETPTKKYESLRLIASFLHGCTVDVLLVRSLIRDILQNLRRNISKEESNGLALVLRASATRDPTFVVDDTLTPLISTPKALNASPDLFVTVLRSLAIIASKRGHRAMSSHLSGIIPVIMEILGIEVPKVSDSVQTFPVYYFGGVENDSGLLSEQVELPSLPSPAMICAALLCLPHILPPEPEAQFFLLFRVAELILYPDAVIRTKAVQVLYEYILHSSDASASLSHVCNIMTAISLRLAPYMTLVDSYRFIHNFGFILAQARGQQIRLADQQCVARVEAAAWSYLWHPIRAIRRKAFGLLLAIRNIRFETEMDAAQIAAIRTIPELVRYLPSIKRQTSETVIDVDSLLDINTQFSEAHKDDSLASSLSKHPWFLPYAIGKHDCTHQGLIAILEELLHPASPQDMDILLQLDDSHIALSKEVANEIDEAYINNQQDVLSRLWSVSSSSRPRKKVVNIAVLMGTSLLRLLDRWIEVCSSLSDHHKTVVCWCWIQCANAWKITQEDGLCAALLRSENALMNGLSKDRSTSSLRRLFHMFPLYHLAMFCCVLRTVDCNSSLETRLGDFITETRPNVERSHRRNLSRSSQVVAKRLSLTTDVTRIVFFDDTPDNSNKYIKSLQDDASLCSFFRSVVVAIAHMSPLSPTSCAIVSSLSFLPRPCFSFLASAMISIGETIASNSDTKRVKPQNRTRSRAGTAQKNERSTEGTLETTYPSNVAKSSSGNLGSDVGSMVFDISTPLSDQENALCLVNAMLSKSPDIVSIECPQLRRILNDFVDVWLTKLGAVDSMNFSTVPAVIKDLQPATLGSIAYLSSQYLRIQAYNSNNNGSTIEAILRIVSTLQLCLDKKIPKASIDEQMSVNQLQEEPIWLACFLKFTTGATGNQQLVARASLAKVLETIAEICTPSSIDPRLANQIHSRAIVIAESLIINGPTYIPQVHMLRSCVSNCIAIWASSHDKIQDLVSASLAEVHIPESDTLASCRPFKDNPCAVNLAVCSFASLTNVVTEQCSELFCTKDTADEIEPIEIPLFLLCLYHLNNTDQISWKLAVQILRVLSSNTREFHTLTNLPISRPNSPYTIQCLLKNYISSLADNCPELLPKILEEFWSFSPLLCISNRRNILLTLFPWLEKLGEELLNRSVNMELAILEEKVVATAKSDASSYATQLFDSTLHIFFAIGRQSSTSNFLVSAIDSALTCFFNSWNILEDDTDDIKERKKLVIFYWSDLVVHRYTHSSEIFEDNFEQDRDRAFARMIQVNLSETCGSDIVFVALSRHWRYSQQIVSPQNEVKSINRQLEYASLVLVLDIIHETNTSLINDKIAALIHSAFTLNAELTPDQKHPILSDLGVELLACILSKLVLLCLSSEYWSNARQICDKQKLRLVHESSSKSSNNEPTLSIALICAILSFLYPQNEALVEKSLSIAQMSVFSSFHRHTETEESEKLDPVICPAVAAASSSIVLQGLINLPLIWSGLDKRTTDDLFDTFYACWGSTSAEKIVEKLGIQPIELAAISVVLMQENQSSVDHTIQYLSLESASALTIRSCNLALKEASSILFNSNESEQSVWNYLVESLVQTITSNFQIIDHPTQFDWNSVTSTIAISMSCLSTCNLSSVSYTNSLRTLLRLIFGVHPDGNLPLHVLHQVKLLSTEDESNFFLLLESIDGFPYAKSSLEQKRRVSNDLRSLLYNEAHLKKQTVLDDIRIHAMNLSNLIHDKLCIDETCSDNLSEDEVWGSILSRLQSLSFLQSKPEIRVAGRIFSMGLLSQCNDWTQTGSIEGVNAVSVVMECLRFSAKIMYMLSSNPTEERVRDAWIHLTQFLSELNWIISVLQSVPQIESLCKLWEVSRTVALDILRRVDCWFRINGKDVEQDEHLSRVRSGSALVGSQAQEMIVELSKIHRMHIMQLLDSLKKYLHENLSNGKQKSVLYAVWCLSETVVHIKESKQIRYALRHTTIDVAIDLILGEGRETLLEIPALRKSLQRCGFTGFTLSQESDLFPEPIEAAKAQQLMLLCLTLEEEMPNFFEFTQNSKTFASSSIRTVDLISWAKVLHQLPAMLTL